jgi:transposase
MSIITVGIDLAKNVFAVHGVDDNGKAVLVKPKVARDKLLELVATLPPCLIGMEACSGAHHWARQFRQYGHTVKLMAPKFVVPYRLSGKRGKTDAADAAAICEAVTRRHMRFVPVKEEHQQIILCLHRTRNGFVEERTAVYNRLRGLISEFGIVLPQKVANLRRQIGEHLEDLPGYANRCVGDLLAHADVLDERIAEYDRAIAQAAREDERSRRLMDLRGIGPTTASALLASLDGGHDFTNGRQVAAWIGLTPGQYSSGGVARLGRITKAGDRYLRSLLVMGARAILSGLGDKQDRFNRWARSLVERRGYWRAVVAIAAKNARLAWAVLRYGEDFRLHAGA